MDQDDIYLPHLAYVHPFIAIAVMDALGYHSPSVAHAIGDAIQDVYSKGLTYKELKQNIAPLVEAIFTHISRSGIPITNKERLHKSIVKSFEIASKLAEKIINVNETDVEKLKTIRQIMGGKIEDPKSKLKEMGIDIEPELEEFRQFLAEISGKKIEPKGSKARKVISEEIPPEVLSIAKALEFSDFSEKAMKKAEKELLKMIDGLLDDEANAVEVFHAVKLLRLVQRGDVEGIKRFGD